MSVLVPIPSSITDPFYRYKRNKLEITIKNRNNGQTKLENIDQIASQLHVSVSCITKAMGKDLGCRITKNVIAGILDLDKLELVLEKFITKHVLCSNCNLPELSSNKGTKSCDACGFLFDTKIPHKNKKEVESACKIDDQAGKIIHRIDALRTKILTKELIDELDKLESRCWECSSENDLEYLQKQMFFMECSIKE